MQLNPTHTGKHTYTVNDTNQYQTNETNRANLHRTIPYNIQIYKRKQTIYVLLTIYTSKSIYILFIAHRSIVKFCTNTTHYNISSPE